MYWGWYTGWKACTVGGTQGGKNVLGVVHRVESMYCGWYTGWKECTGGGTQGGKHVLGGGATRVGTTVAT